MCYRICNCVCVHTYTCPLAEDFSAAAPLTSGVDTPLLRGALSCPVHCRVFSNTLGLYPVNDSSIASVVTTTYFQTLPYVP